MLKTYVEFRSNLFPKQPNESIDSNGEIWGVKLAEFLCQQFNAKGIACLGFCEEDWGYRIFFDSSFHSKVWLGCGHYEHENGFLIFLEPKNPVIKKWFAPNIDLTEQMQVILQTLESIIYENINISDVHWWTEEQFMKGSSEN